MTNWCSVQGRVLPLSSRKRWGWQFLKLASKATLLTWWRKIRVICLCMMRFSSWVLMTSISQQRLLKKAKLEWLRLGTWSSRKTLKWIGDGLTRSNGQYKKGLSILWASRLILRMNDAACDPAPPTTNQ
jgi:hypothetical protein